MSDDQNDDALASGAPDAHRKRGRKPRNDAPMTQYARMAEYRKRQDQAGRVFITAIVAEQTRALIASMAEKEQLTYGQLIDRLVRNAADASAPDGQVTPALAASPAERFRALRLKKGYTIAELASLLDVGERTIQRWEAGGDVKATALMQLEALTSRASDHGTRQGPRDRARQGNKPEYPENPS